MTLPGIDFRRTRLELHNVIGNMSGWSKCVLRRQGLADRECVACVTQYLPKERVGQMIDPLDSKCRVSALAPDGVAVLSPEPDNNKNDVLVVFNPDGSEQSPWRITSRPKVVEPTPGIPLLWTMSVRR